MKNEGMKKPKKKIFRKILLGILVVIVAVFAFKMFLKFIHGVKDKIMSNKINSISREKINYVFIEINPSLVLTIMDGKVKDVACLNNDCVDMFDDIDIMGKDIADSIDSLYNIAKDKGYDTSNGVKVKTTGKININKEYVTVEYINEATKNELISKVINNEKIKDNTNNNYYTKLWEELKKDDEYDVVYTCSMNNDELECYIKNDFIIVYDTGEGSDTADYATMIRLWNKALPQMERIARVLKKFGVPIETDREILVLTNPIGILNYHGSKLSIDEFITTRDIVYSGKVRCDIYEVHLNDINLLKPYDIPIKLQVEEDEEVFYEGKTETHVNPIHCGENYCGRNTLKETLYCNYYESEGYGDYNREIINIYEICDLNMENCHEVPFEEYKYFDF